MEAAVRGTDLHAVAILGQVKSTVRALLSLQRGDVIRLENHPQEPIELRTGDKVLLRGVPLVRHGNLALQVSDIGSQDDR